MATKTKKITPIKKGIETVTTAVTDLNTKAVEVSTEVVEETVVTGKQWQELMAKGLKEGTTLFGQQQDMVLTTLESLKGQYITGNQKLRKLFAFDFKFGFDGFNFGKAETTVKEVAATTKKTVVAKTNKAKTTAKKVVKSAKATTATAKKVTAKAATTAKKVTAKKVTTKAKVATTAKKAVKATAKKVTTPKVVSKATTTAKKATTTVKVAAPTATIKTVGAKATIIRSAKDNLRLIEGIGPKIEGLLNEAGIKTFKELENAKLITLAGILDAAGSRYRMHDPATWGAQAGMAAEGKMTELKKWQAELKGGKVSK